MNKKKYKSKIKWVSLNRIFSVPTFKFSKVSDANSSLFKLKKSLSFAAALDSNKSWILLMNFFLRVSKRDFFMPHVFERYHQRGIEKCMARSHYRQISIHDMPPRKRSGISIFFESAKRVQVLFGKII